jgi:hypothetical protein
LPYYGWQLTAAIPPHGSPQEPATMGEHILRRRLDLGMTKKATAQALELMRSQSHFGKRSVDMSKCDSILQ